MIESFCDGCYLRNKPDLHCFGDAFVSKADDQKGILCLMYPVLILIKVQFLLYRLLEKLKLHYNLC